MKKSVICLSILLYALLVQAEEEKLTSKSPEVKVIKVSAKDVNTPYLGILVRRADETLLRQLNPPNNAGLVVIDVKDGSPAAKAGIQPHDILIRAQDQWLYSPEQLALFISNFNPGDIISIELLRQGKKNLVNVKLEAAPTMHKLRPKKEGWIGGWYIPPQSVPIPPPPLPPTFETLRQWQKEFNKWLKEFHESIQPPLKEKTEVYPPTSPLPPRLGIKISKPDEALLAQLGRSPEEGGVLVIEVLPGSLAQQAGIKQYDLIVEINGKKIKGPEHLQRIIQQLTTGELQIKLIRQGKETDLTIQLPSQDKPQPFKRESFPKPLEEGPGPRLEKLIVTKIGQEGISTILKVENGKSSLEVLDSEGKPLYKIENLSL